MSKHEQYEELCTLAVIGEVSDSEMQDLRRHLGECADCREQYREFTQFLLPQLFISADNDAAFETGYSKADRNRLRREFLAGAQKKGRVFSQEAISGAAPNTSPRPRQAAPRRLPRRVYRWALAASIATLLFAGGYWSRVALVHRKEAANVANQGPSNAPTHGQAGHDAATSSAAIAELRATNEADAKTIAALSKKLSDTVAEFQDAEHASQASEEALTALQGELNAKNNQLVSLQSQEQVREQNVADLQTQVAALQQQVEDSRAAAAANELRARDLNDRLAAQTASLDREREMLSVGRDVRDLMGARNLHIIDVHDANGAGKNQKSFGRVFYTEGKSLIFYAFDLDDKKVQNANYSFEAWGEKLGQPSSVKSLGVLYVDDKAQRRWSLKVNDPHQLAEINSLFVTLEPHAGGQNTPQGKRILFAFLGGEANHP